MKARDEIRGALLFVGSSEQDAEALLGRALAEVLREEARRLRHLADEMPEGGRARQSEGLYRAALVLEERADETGKDTRKGESTRGEMVGCSRSSCRRGEWSAKAAERGWEQDASGAWLCPQCAADAADRRDYLAAGGDAE